MNQAAFIGFASGWGAQIRETEKGPTALYHSGVLSSLALPWTWKETLAPSKTAEDINLPPGQETLPYITELCCRTSKAIEDALQNKQFPIIIGGDHTAAIGTWNGIAHYFKAQQHLGLIWIDAHMDAHTRETTPSQAYHGMPLAVLLGYGEDSLVNLLGKGPILNPHHVSLIGVRSWEEGEAALLQRLGVRVYFMKDVQARGFDVIFQESLERAKQGTKGFGISIDLDAFDPSIAPGVGSAVPHGLKAQEVLPALARAQNDSFFKAFEIVEYNPDLDKHRKTLLLIRDLLLTLLPQEEVSHEI